MNNNRIITRIGEEGRIIDGVSYKNVKVVSFEHHHYIVSDKAILTAVVTPSCNSNCRFCSNHITFTPTGQFLEWNKKLSRLIDFCKIAKIPKVAFTGGEPTLQPKRLVSLAGKVAPHFERVRIHTNGYNLLTPVELDSYDGTLLEALGDIGLNGVSISVSHWNKDINNHIMRNGEWVGLTDDDIVAIVELCREKNITVRLSCVMTEDGVKNTQDILSFIEWGNNLGVRCFIFRCLSVIPSGYKSKTNYTEYNDRNWIDVRPIARELNQTPGFDETYFQYKSDSYLHVYETANGSVIDLDEASEEIDPDPKIRRLVLMPDSEAYTSWIEKKKLFPTTLPISQQSAKPHSLVLNTPQALLRPDPTDSYEI